MLGRPGGTGGTGGVDDAFLRLFAPGIGAEIMGAGKFGHPRWFWRSPGLFWAPPGSWVRSAATWYTGSDCRPRGSR
jgi:hypothetical protein